MTATHVIALLHEILATLPLAITTGGQLMTLINETYKSLNESITGSDITDADMAELIERIVANSTAIQAIK